MNIINTIHAEKIEQALINYNTFDSSQPLIDELVILNQLLSISDIEELCHMADKAGLSLSDDAPEYIELHHIALLIELVCMPLNTPNIKSFLELCADKWEPVENESWEWFSSQIAFKWEVDDQSRYWAVTTEYRLGDLVGQSLSLVQLCNDDQVCEDLELIIQLESAHQFNSGVFDEDLYGIPCFDVDGYIAYPSDIKEISKSAFNTLFMFHPNTVLIEPNNLSEQVISALNSSEF